MKKIKCKTGEIAKTYKEYLLTDHWGKIKRRFFKSSYSHGRCYFCQSRRVQLHHKTYERLGKERLSDLVEVCRKHHLAVHNKEIKFRRRKRAKKIKGNMTKKQMDNALKLRNKNMRYTEKIEDGILIKVYKVPKNSKCIY
jgi:hypothetical protein